MIGNGGITGGGDSFWDQTGDDIRNNNDGNVGVGKEATEKLDVNGSVKASGYKSSDGSAGYSTGGGGEIYIGGSRGVNHYFTVKNGLITNYREEAPV